MNTKNITNDKSLNEILNISNNNKNEYSNDMTLLDILKISDIKNELNIEYKRRDYANPIKNISEYINQKKNTNKSYLNSFDELINTIDINDYTDKSLFIIFLFILCLIIILIRII